MDVAAAKDAPEIADAECRPALRFLTCGSVDDGKSTLIGRLLHEQNLIPDDRQAALARDSKKYGAAGGELDYALLLDGLEAEREQGITIDVAWRYFATTRRSFIVADAPGHEQYTRNMVTAASNADLAVLLVDARKGLTRQTRRHAVIASLMGIRTIALAVNKIDLVDFDERIFARIVEDFLGFSGEFGLRRIDAFPLSARYGDNVSAASARTPWYGGPALLDYLESAGIDDARAAKSFRMAVQWVNRPQAGFRGLAGTLAAGCARPGDRIVILPSGQNATIKTVAAGGDNIAEAAAGDAVTLTLAEDIDAARGDMLAAADNPPQIADQFAAHLIWLSETPLYPGRSYLMKINNVTLAASVSKLKHRIDVETLAKLAAKTLAVNEAGVCNVSVARPVAFDAYADNRDTGAFILIDRGSNETVAAGMIDYALWRAGNIRRHPMTVSRAARAALMQHRPAVLWFTGLPGAGKS
ncbi:MAG TPA: GTP-binding protein, partial [Rhizomicrobium sp.]